MKTKQSKDDPVSRARGEARQVHILRGGREWMVVRRAKLWQPPTDVFEEDDRLIVLVEIAGMKSADFHISLTPQQLVISGTRMVREQNCTAYHQLEIPYGDFRTHATLPWPVAEESVTAQYEDGLLRVMLPKAATESVRVIPVGRSRD